MKAAQYKYTFVIRLVVVVWLLGATLYFAHYSNRAQLEDANKRYEEITRSDATEVHFAVERYLNIMASAAEFIVKYDDFTSPEVLQSLSDISENNDFNRLAIDIADGPGYTSDGHVVDTSVFAYGDRTRKGEPFVLDVVSAIVDDIPMVGFLVPLKGQDGKYEAALRGSISTDALTSMFEKTFVDTGGYFSVIDGSGNIVAQSQFTDRIIYEEGTYFDNIEKLEFESGYSAAQIRQLFENQEGGISKYSYMGKSRTCYFEPVGVNNWMVLNSIPTEAIYGVLAKHTTNVIIYISQLFVIFAALLCYIYITQRKSKERALLDAQCFKALSEHTNNVVFEWEFSTNRITAMSNFQQLFGRNPSTVNAAEDALNANAVHPEDKASFTQVFQTISSGDMVKDAHFRVVDNGGIYHWCSLSALVICDKKGKPFKAIGSLKNIEEQLQKEKQLRIKAESDQLTGLYNKATTELLIKDALQNKGDSGECALLIIDVDNFKMVNDSLGHLYGDTVLTELAEELRLLFRTNDIVGRVGGDEFFVLLKDYRRKDLPEQKAAAICDAFRKSYAGGSAAVKVSASIGIALFPSHGDNYETLYQHADLALYDAKSKGKNGYALYCGQQITSYHATRENDEIMNDRTIKTFASDPESFVFHLLYETPDTEAAITTVLRLATETFGVGRAYIIEFNQEKNMMNNTYEWCVPGIKPEIDNLKDIPVSAFAEGLASMGKTGLYIIGNVDELPEGSTKDILMPQGIKSLIHSAIVVNGQLEAFIGFDDCENYRTPTKQELEIITTICRLIGTFLTRMRATEAEKRARDLLMDVLLNKTSMTYVIDPDTLNILYENNTVVSFFGQSSLGQKCYEAFRGESTACANCPCQHLSDHVLTSATDVFNNKLNKEMHLVATRLEWPGHKNAYLLRCTELAEDNEATTDFPRA